MFGSPVGAIVDTSIEIRFIVSTIDRDSKVDWSVGRHYSSAATERATEVITLCLKDVSARCEELSPMPHRTEIWKIK